MAVEMLNWKAGAWTAHSVLATLCRDVAIEQDAHIFVHLCNHVYDILYLMNVDIWPHELITAHKVQLINRANGTHMYSYYIPDWDVRAQVACSPIQRYNST